VVVAAVNVVELRREYNKQTRLEKLPVLEYEQVTCWVRVRVGLLDFKFEEECLPNRYFVGVIKYNFDARLCTSHIQPKILPKDDIEL